MTLETVLTIAGIVCLLIGVGALCFEAGKEHGYVRAQEGFERMRRIRERQERLERDR